MRRAALPSDLSLGGLLWPIQGLLLGTAPEPSDSIGRPAAAVLPTGRGGGGGEEDPGHTNLLARTKARTGAYRNKFLSKKGSIQSPILDLMHERPQGARGAGPLILIWSEDSPRDSGRAFGPDPLRGPSF